MKRSTQEHLFSHIPSAQIPRSAFNRSHTHKTTFNAGYLIPIYVDEALPGDTFKVKLSAFARLATPISPFMDNLWMDFFFFAVPNRLLWDNWQKFMGEQTNPGDSVDYLIPQVSTPETGILAGELFDYFGLPTGISTYTVNALPARAYNLIWNEWFRDENLQNSVPVHKDDGPDSAASYVLLKRGKRHDYFTSCLPWPQKGPGVEIPLGATAPVLPLGTGLPTFQGIPNNPTGPLGKAATSPFVEHGDNTNLTPGTLKWADPALYADLSTATAASINSLRQAFQLQRLLERDARGGTRYTEILKAHFGVVSPDARLQRPEYLGGGTVPININPVPQTSETSPVTPQGNLAAYGTAVANGIGFAKSFVEHMTIIGLVMARADLSYQQGLHRMWSRNTRWDFFWPAFAYLGEQAVLNKEIYFAGEAADEDVFGYQERWAEYRYFPSKITGKLRSTEPGGLDSWHLAQYFLTRPTLNATFIEENPPVERVIAVQTEPHFIFDSLISIHAARPMPTYSVPGLIDHF